MKKIFSLMLVALVMLGVTACEQNVTIDTPKSEGLSFYAEIAMTRADLEQGADSKWTTVWEGNETLYVNDFVFTNTEEEPNMFTCTAKGVTKLVGETVTITMNSDSVPTTGKGIMIEQTIESFNPESAISLTAKNAFLRFYYVGEAKFTLGDALFVNGGESTNEITATYNGGAWVSVLPGTTSLNFTGLVNSEEKSKDSITFEAGKVYNLGMLMESEVNEMFGIVGGHNGWNTENADALYLIPNSNTYVKYDVALTGGFKFYGETTKTVIVEHPAVTTGEEGDWYLQPNSNWKEANARFAIYFFGNGDTWVSMKDDNGDGIYVANNPTDGKTYPNMIFCRMNPSNTDNNWNNKWNQTGDLTCPTDGKNCFTVPSGSWDGATTSWSVHTPEVKDAWTEEVEEVTSYWIGNGDKNTNYLTSWATGWSNNSGENITVADTNKTYDIYFSKGEMQDWGFEVYYTVLESGSEAPTLK